MTDDVVAELDAELALIEELPYRVPIHLLAKRARDEILALRAFKARVFADVRAEVLEEAEIACLTEARDYVISLGQDNYRDGCRNCAAAIRALKDKPKCP